jgi:UMF1 family MFS transporter
MAAPLSTARERTGWYFYDWANSAFSTTVVTLLLGPYLSSLAKAAADAQGLVHPFGIPVYAGSYWGYLLSLSVMSQVVLLPLAGAVADASGRKKQLLALFAYTGAAATAAMFFVRGQAYVAGGLLFLIANLAFGASVVVYNSFLPDIASERERDEVSSKGWGIGYLGGGLLLAITWRSQRRRTRSG